MTTEAVDSVFAEACRRLFDLHANGYKRPRPEIKPRPAAVPNATRRGRTVVRARAGRWML